MELLLVDEKRPWHGNPRESPSAVSAEGDILMGYDGDVDGICIG